MTDSGLNASSSSSSEHEIDLSQLLRALRRAWLPVALAAALLGGLTYVLSKRQAPSYQASTTLMSTLADNSNRVLSGASVSAPQLPDGAVPEVVHSRSSVQEMVKTIQASALPDAVKAKIERDLTAELASETYRRVSITAKTDLYQRGVYDLTATAETPEAARVLADAAAQALLDWDSGRARTAIERARENIQRQLENVSARIAALPAGSLEAQGLTAARGQLSLDLSQATVFEGSATGSLTLLKEANAPSRPVSPKPTRNAVLVFLLTLLLGAGLAVLREVTRQRVQSSADLIGLGVPVLGEWPRLRRAARTGTVQQAQQGSLYEPAGFARVNLTRLAAGTTSGKRAGDAPGQPLLLTVSSARPGEGKSSVVAALATSFAQAQRRVLVVDLDLHRPSQQQFWPTAQPEWVPLPGSSEARQTGAAQAIEFPQHASALRVAANIDLLPAGTTGRHAASQLNSPGFPGLLRTWADGYDVVILDTPPMLALSDALTVAAHTDGVLLVVENGQTTVAELRGVLNNLNLSRVRLLGAVLNKVRQGDSGYMYRYDYAQKA